MNTIANNIRMRLSLREPLAEALEVMTKLADCLTLKKYGDYNDTEGYKAFLDGQLAAVQESCPQCRNFERDFPSFAFSIATGIGKTRLMAACIAYLYLAKGIKHFFILAPNLTLYDKLIRDFGDTSYEKYVFKGLAEFVHNQPIVVNGETYNNFNGQYNTSGSIEINIFNIAKFNTDNKESAKKGAPRMRRLSEYLGQSYFDYLASLPDLVILMDEAHRYHADASKKAINELHPILGLEMTATPIDEHRTPFKNIVYEYNLAQALVDGKYVKIPTVAKRKNFTKAGLSAEDLDAMKIEDAISIHEHTKTCLELYAKNNHLPVVKPFILVVCRDVAHATQTATLIEKQMFEGRYAGKVLQIDSSTKKDEDIERQFLSLEKADNKIEIVIHVNMLKEGWDVTNLYTIVPLRAADAPVLVEQTIGRGLRLPYGGKRTGNADIDKLTVIAHENFDAVIAASKNPDSVLSRFSYIQLDDDELKSEPSKVESAQTILDFHEREALAKAATDAERKDAKTICDAQRAVWDIIPTLSSAVKNKTELMKPELRKTIKELAERKIIDSAKQASPMFASQEAAPIIATLDRTIDTAINTYINNVIEIPCMTIQRKEVRAEYKWFDLDTSIGFDLPVLRNEILRQSIGTGDITTDIIQAQSGRTIDSPCSIIVKELSNYEDIDYDQCSDLLYHLAEDAINAIRKNSNSTDNINEIVHTLRGSIAQNIHEQMRRHFVIEETEFEKPTVLPFTKIEEQNIVVVDGYGRKGFREMVSPSDATKYVFTGFLKSYYKECKFDSKTELDFANALENDQDVLRWLRPAPKQFNIYWNNGSKRYEPDFIAETADCIYMIETKAANVLTSEEVSAKKHAAEEYCRHATEYNTANEGKRWKYILISSTAVNNTHSLQMMIANSTTI
ncbi:MAG: DEAD/DEAH box helicase family protein [Alistipes sp.]